MGLMLEHQVSKSYDCNDKVKFGASGTAYVGPKACLA